MLTRAVMGHGWFYYVTIASVLLVLALSANTAFADSPASPAHRPRRLHAPRLPAARAAPALFLGHLCPGGAHRRLLIIFGGVTDRLIRSMPSARSWPSPLAGRHGHALEA